jgi:hypothetical protein
LIAPGIISGVLSLSAFLNFVPADMVEDYRTQIYQFPNLTNYRI